MKIIGGYRVVDALVDWGTHNTRWRAGRDIRDALRGVDFALTYYAALVSKILALEPFGCARVELVAEDARKIRLFDRNTPSDQCLTADQWATGAKDDMFVRRYMEADRVLGPLTCTSKGETTADDLRLSLPLVMFDGFTRVAAWILHGRNEKVYPIVANLILTKKDAMKGSAQ